LHALGAAGLTGMRATLLDYARDECNLRQIDRVLQVVGSPNEMTPIQAYTLAALANARRPQVILDLGTGLGNSAAVFGVSRPAARTYTFDIDDKWQRITLPGLQSNGFAPNVKPIVGDMTRVDFAPLIGDASNVLVFWDAHGFAIADLVLAHILPIISDRQHIVVCHDMTYAAGNSFDYRGKTIWRGTDAYYSANSGMAYVVIGWAMTVCEQAISIFDFCARNGMEFKSVDVAMGIHDQSAFQELGKALRISPMQRFHMGYFSMEDTTDRHFPARAVYSGAWQAKS